MGANTNPATTSPDASQSRGSKSSQKRPHENAKPVPLPWEPPTGSLEVPCGEVSFNQSAEKMFERAGKSGRLFVKDKVVVELVERKGKKELEPMTPVRFISFAEELGPLVAYRRYRDGGCRWSPALLNEEKAAALLETEAARNLPAISVISKCPVLVFDEEVPVILGQGYHAKYRLLIVDGEMPPNVPFDDAVAKIKDIHSEYWFATEGDRARAYASFLTPALLMVIRTRAPIEVAEADARRAGKGYRQKMIAAAYNDICRDATKRRGCGSIEETLGGIWLSGHKMARLDNVRGLIDSQWIENFTDSDDVGVRLPYLREVRLDPSPHLLYITSNGLQATPDLADRALIIRTISRDYYPYRKYSEGYLLDHVRANQPYILGCIYSVITHWWNEGCRMRQDTPHRVQPWAGMCDEIVQTIFGTPALMEGHEEVQKRSSNFALTATRELCVAAKETGKLDVDLFANDLAQLRSMCGINIPGVKPDSTDEQAYKQVGKMLGKLFGSRATDKIVLDGFTIKRKEVMKRDPKSGSTFNSKVYSITIQDPVAAMQQDKPGPPPA